MKIQLVNSVNDFLRVIHQTENKNKICYRGQRYSEYRLEPSLFREKEVILEGSADSVQLRSYKFKDENGALKVFKKNLSMRLDTSEFDDIHFLYLMQHYDIHTRLLDFSTNPLIALFFSVSQKNAIDKENENMFFGQESLNDYNKESSAIFCIDPFHVNKHSFNKAEIIDLSNYKFSTLKNLDFPICIKPKRPEINDRLIAQQGVFVYFGKEVFPLDYYTIYNEDILKIIIPNSKRERIKNDLKKHFNISSSTVFPDMKGVTLEALEVLNRTFK